MKMSVKNFFKVGFLVLIAMSLCVTFMSCDGANRKFKVVFKAADGGHVTGTQTVTMTYGDIWEQKGNNKLAKAIKAKFDETKFTGKDGTHDYVLSVAKDWIDTGFTNKSKVDNVVYVHAVCNAVNVTITDHNSNIAPVAIPSLTTLNMADKDAYDKAVKAFWKELKESLDSTDYFIPATDFYYTNELYNAKNNVFGYGDPLYDATKTIHIYAAPKKITIAGASLKKGENCKGFNDEDSPAGNLGTDVDLNIANGADVVNRDIEKDIVANAYFPVKKNAEDEVIYEYGFKYLAKAADGAEAFSTDLIFDKANLPTELFVIGAPKALKITFKVAEGTEGANVNVAKDEFGNSGEGTYTVDMTSKADFDKFFGNFSSTDKNKKIKFYNGATAFTFASNVSLAEAEAGITITVKAE